MTNQASEDERTKLALILGYERQEQHSSEKTRWYDLDEYGNPIEVTKKVDKVIDLIRTEKLKLLAEVRGRVVGENINETNMGDTFKVNYARGWNISKAGIRAELTKLEAEL